jgi:multidrug resistance efflux pump
VARLMLAERALETAEAKVRTLKAIIHEAQAADEALHAGTEAGIKARTNRRPRLGERLVRGNASIVRTGAKGKGGTR